MSEDKKLYTETSKIPAAEFELVHNDENLHDTKFETKPVGWFEASIKRFAKNPASVVGFALIAILTLFSIIVPIVSPFNHYSHPDFRRGFADTHLKECAPKLFNDAGGFWDGTESKTINEQMYTIYQNYDSNKPYMIGNKGKEVTKKNKYSMIQDEKQFLIRHDTYAIGTVEQDITTDAELNSIFEYENKKGISFNLDTNFHKSIVKPIVDYHNYCNNELIDWLTAKGVDSSTAKNLADKMKSNYNSNPNIYFKLVPFNIRGTVFSETKFEALLDANNQVQEIYKRDTTGNFVFRDTDSSNSHVRVDYNSYFKFKYGKDFRFIFGATGEGKDLFTKLAEGGRFSLILGIGISFINFIIGLIWGSISGYYGGTIDLAMERFTDIIGNIPTVILLSLCSIQFTNNVALKQAIGPAGIVILAFFVAFIFNGWIGVSATTRMQFYRFKGQEYVLASRTLGAKDRRLIFKHILPNAIGTLVTRCVLMIPGVIFAESSLSYLGIINFNESGISSIGDILSNAEGNYQAYPYRLLFPALIISVLMIAYNLFGNGLRDAFNTTLRGSED